MSQKLLHDFVTLFVVLDPVGMLAIFVAICADLTPAEQRKAAILGVLYSFVTLLFFIVVGELLLIQMGIPLPAFQIAGGILLLLLGIEMSRGENTPGRDGAGRSAAANRKCSIDCLDRRPFVVDGISARVRCVRWPNGATVGSSYP